MCPKVSVLVTTYNQELYIEEALVSALEQDYSPLEVVVTDDASTDRTPQILGRLKEKYGDRLILLLGEKNLGITGSSNRALARCTGDYIALQDGDDVLLPGKIRKQVAWLEEDPRRVICYHDVEVFQSPGGMSRGLYSKRHPMRSGDLREIILSCVFFAYSSVMFRASCKPASGFDERIRWSSDYLFLMQLLRRSNGFPQAIGFVPGVLARYRRHRSNVTLKARSWGLQEELRSLEIIEEAVPEASGAVRVAKCERMCSYAAKRIVQGEILGGLGLLLQGTRISTEGLWRSVENGFRYLLWGRRMFR